MSFVSLCLSDRTKEKDLVHVIAGCSTHPTRGRWIQTAQASGLCGYTAQRETIYSVKVGQSCAVLSVV